MKQLYFSLIFTITSLASFAQTNFTDTKGELSISNSGQASYNLPIALPPSLKNVAPVINLTYSSGQRGGIAGQGWSMNGISSISRMSTRVDIDGFRDGVDFDDNDKLSLDGQRLLLKTGTYWANNSTYETEYKSNTKIELKIENAPGFGSQTYFVVTSPDGSQTWYGSTGSGVFQNATSLNAWFIVRFVDTHGNFITYNYTQFTYNNTAQTYIDNIKFSGNEGQGFAQINEIKFNYRTGNASRVEVDYIKGQAFYAFKVLDKIQVLTGGVQFRKYVIAQVADDSGYERVRVVEEYNGANEPSNPLLFTYETTPTVTCYGPITVSPVAHGSSNLCPTTKEYNTSMNFNAIALSGDFDGDGQLDFIANNQLYTGLLNGGSGNAPIQLPFSASNTTTFSGSLINNNKLNQKNSIINIEDTLSGTVINCYDIDGNNILNTFSESIPLTTTTNYIVTQTTQYLLDEDVYYVCGNGNNCQEFQPGQSTENLGITEFTAGDFNGDGITEILILKPSDKTYIQEYVSVIASNGTCQFCNQAATQTSNMYYVYDLNTNTTNDKLQLIDSTNLLGGKKIAQDFNGDGKTDILVMRLGNFRIFTFAENAAGSKTVQLIGETNIPNFSYAKPLLFGDYNGDGKIDFMIPDAINSDWWTIYFANPNPNGGGFFSEFRFQSIIYKPSDHSPNGLWHDYNSYHAMDINKDGKSDLVKVFNTEYKVPITINNWDSKWQITGYTNNIGKGAEKFTETHKSLVGWTENPASPITLTTNYRYQGQNTDLVIINNFDNNVKYYKFNGDFNANNRLKTVSEANGKIIQTINYAPMIAADEQLGTTADFYSSTNTATYPNLEVIKNRNSFLVSKLTATINGVSKFQDFKYRSMVSNFEYGTIGFVRTARSSWYTTSLTDKIWTVQEIDPSKRGASTNTWSTTSGDNVFATTPTELLSTKTNEFETYTNPTTKQYNVLLKKQTTIDHLTTVKNETTYSYDGLIDNTTAFGLQTKTTNNTYLDTVLQGTSTTTTTHKNNAAGVGGAYFIGKPETVVFSKTIYPNDATKTDTRVSEEKYTYDGFNISKIEKKGHNTPNSIFEEMTYDAFGNLLTKKISCPSALPALASRTITDEYDLITKRFVVNKTDHQGFVTRLQYNNIGQVTESIKYLGTENTANLSSKSNFVFDSWGKLTSSTTTGASTTALTSTTVYAKLNDGGYTSKNTNNTNGAESTTQYDVLGRVVKSTTSGFASGSTISKSVVYDDLGRKTKEYEPYFTTLGKFTAYEYDYLQRPIKVTAPTGRLQKLTYNGLTTNSLDDTKTTSATVDALGNKVITTDEGGTINFKYFANGQVKETDYGGHKITVAIDGWGNKTSMTDPNAGTYTYVTDEFGQAKTETTPKGTTTFAYDTFGKLITKTVLGDGADIVTTYAYNSFAQLVSETSKKANNATIDGFTYRYDTLKRLDKTTETNPAFTHSKTITFDTYGRPATETTLTTDTASGLSATVVAKSNYNTYNGIMDKLTDANNAVLWQLNSANEKMQALTATLGNGVAVTNVYDANSYFSSQKHAKNGIDVLNNTYNFNAIKGNLNNRQNVTLALNEVFTYDNLDRLTSWTNLTVNGAETQTYDERGRIETNSLGEYNYTNSAANGMYRKTSIDLSTEGTAQYATKPLQRVTYTMFKSPITINESGLGATRFTYNSHLSRTRMQYGWTTGPVTAPLLAASSMGINTLASTTATPVAAAIPQPTGSYTKTKWYTDDGSTEIIKADGKIRIITYIGGTAYSAPLYNEKVKTISGGAITDNNYYLHRDYLGSIIAISNTAGVAVERRHFDAWGNLAKLETNGIIAPLNLGGAGGGLMLDRGYTSHEHLAEVGLINMNGRLYDPKLHTFLMPDNFVQQPENTQNYNRYAYVLNNPLRYTDPSGEEFLLLTAVLIGSAISAATYTIICLTSAQNFSFGGLAQATFIGAASAAVTFGIGSAAGSMFGVSSTFAKATFQAIAHGTFQGGMTAINGGNFWNGFAAGALSSIASSAFSWDGNGTANGLGWGSSVRDSGAGMIAFGTIAGGLGAELTGGNFWQGAVTGLIVSALNHYAHQQPKPKAQKLTWDTNKDGILQKGEADSWYLYGNGEPITVDNSKIDWTGLKMPLTGDANFAISTIDAFTDLPLETAATYGGTSFQRTSAKTAIVRDQLYHYELRPNNSFGNFGRNIMNELGRAGGTNYTNTGQAPLTGTSYMIHYSNPTIRFK